jgi:acyl-coenzyme A synthetase/AMP-(fatty) acid ligase
VNLFSVLEEVLLTHPAVADAAVVPSHHEQVGEVPKAFVTLRRSASAHELVAWVAEQVAPCPRIRQVEFVDLIPRSLSASAT